MYKVIQRIGVNFLDNPKQLGIFKTFEEAHKFAVDNVCPDLFNEPRLGADVYWFTDEPYTHQDDVGYKVKIEKIN